MNGPGFALTIDGCPYAFTTGSVNAVPTNGTSDWPTGVTFAIGGLVNPIERGLTWSERMQPLDSSLEVGGVTLELHDNTVTSGAASGHPIVTYLSTRRLGQLTNTELAASITSSATGAALTVVTGTGANFPSGSQVVWVDQEAILCDSRSGDTFTINTSGRGYYGSSAVAHNIDTSNSYAPTLWGSYPGFTRRRTLLWYFDASGNATVLWRGYCMRAPRLSKNKATYELQLESAWTVERAAPLGVPQATTSLRGFDVNAGVVLLQPASGADAYATQTAMQWSNANRIQPNFQGFLGQVAHQFLAGAATVTALNGHIDTVTLTQVSGGVQFVGQTNTLGATSWIVAVGPVTNLTVANSRTTSEPYRTTFTLPVAPDILVAFSADNGFASVAVDNTYGMPSSWDSTYASDGPYTTSSRPVLRGEYGKDYFLVIEPLSVTAAGLGTNAPYVTGHVRIHDKVTDQIINTLDYRQDANFILPLFSGSCGVLTQSCTLRLTAVIDTSHWMYGLQHSILGDTSYVRSGADLRNWDFSTAGWVTRIVGGDRGMMERHWYLDGRDTVQSIIDAQCKLSGCAVGIRSGAKMAIVPFSQPLDTDTVVATLTKASFVDDEQPVWTLFPDGLCNVVSISSDNGTITVRDQRSTSQFGPARTVEIKLPGADVDFSNPVNVAQYALRRVVGLWSKPTALVTFKLPLSYLIGDGVAAINLGDFVSISDPRIPDGLGDRSGTARVVQIIGRNISIAASAAGQSRGYVEYEAVDYQADYLAGYAPCCRVSSIAGGTLNIATAYLSSAATDYAASNLTGYAYASTAANDGGVSWWKVGMTCRLVQRDTTSLVQETGFTVTGVNPGAKTITVTPNPTTVVGGNIVDVIFDAYGNGAGPKDSQKVFAWVGSYTTNVIGTSTDHAKAWAA